MRTPHQSRSSCSDGHDAHASARPCVRACTRVSPQWRLCMHNKVQEAALRVAPWVLVAAAASVITVRADRDTLHNRKRNALEAEREHFYAAIDSGGTQPRLRRAARREPAATALRALRSMMGIAWNYHAGENNETRPAGRGSATHVLESPGGLNPSDKLVGTGRTGD